MSLLKIRILVLISLFMFSFVMNGICLDNNSDLINNLKLIEDKMSDINTLATQFIQEKNLALFNQKIEITGFLYLQKPSSFAWHINTPLEQRIILKSNNVVQWDEDTNQVQKINLSSNPTFNIVMDQMKRWISGAYLSLVDEYIVEFKKSEFMELKFFPKDGTMAYKLIKNINIVFQEDEKYIESITINERNGDSTSFIFFETQINIVLDPIVWEVNPRDK
ncbi:MAG: outer membrane lipoprotein carrier protein LolA [Candidatus Omnitrophica bacterium]|nr:outer membrane lipoprotein carrier protein LolA [Candidatus Omnitrophota bacterium]MCK5492280.1 outer membrane lipoprotein carrier protein LolA [Candidatus Omnitrophota bacterium]